MGAEWEKGESRGSPGMLRKGEKRHFARWKAKGTCLDKNAQPGETPNLTSTEPESEKGMGRAAGQGGGGRASREKQVQRGLAPK